MGKKFAKGALYVLFILLIIWGQFLSNQGLVTGTAPLIKGQTIQGKNALETIRKGPAIIYFWAEWCGLCKMMQSPVSAVLNDYPGLTISLKSGDSDAIKQYLKQHSLHWNVVNDVTGELSAQYKVQGVPTVFIINEKGQISFTSVGYTSEIGLRFRLWLSGIKPFL